MVGVPGSTRQFGRRLIVTVDDVDVCDYDDSRGTGAAAGLDCAFNVTMHTRLEAQPASVTVYGLNKSTRDALDRRRDEALETAYRERTARKLGRVKITAGRPDAFGLLADHEIMDIRHHREGGDWRTEISALDGRIQWRSGFVTESTSGGVDLSTVEQIINAAVPILEGKAPPDVFQAAFPELLSMTGVGGYEQGLVMFGPSIDENQNLEQLLGLRGFWNKGQFTYIRADLPGLDLALVLVEGTNVLEIQSESRGYVRITCLMDYRVEPGRQIVLLKTDGTFYGGAPTYRVEQVEHQGSVWDTSWESTAVLRPSRDVKAEALAAAAAKQAAFLKVLAAPFEDVDLDNPFG